MSHSDATAKIALALLLPLCKISPLIGCFDSVPEMVTRHSNPKVNHTLIVHKYKENIKVIINGIGSERRRKSEFASKTCVSQFLLRVLISR